MRFVCVVAKELNNLTISHHRDVNIVASEQPLNGLFRCTDRPASVNCFDSGDGVLNL